MIFSEKSSHDKHYGPEAFVPPSPQVGKQFSPGGESFKGGEGVKMDQGKPQFGLIPQNALLEVAKVMTYGAKKYAPGNWKKVDDAHARYVEAALRHINAHLRGLRMDDESNLKHLAHAVASLMMAMESDEYAD